MNNSAPHEGWNKKVMGVLYTKATLVDMNYCKTDVPHTLSS